MSFPLTIQMVASGKSAVMFFDNQMKVGEAVFAIREKIRQDEGEGEGLLGEGKEEREKTEEAKDTTKEESERFQLRKKAWRATQVQTKYGLLIPPNEENEKPRWMEDNKVLDDYSLPPKTVVIYRKKTRQLQVDLVDGTKPLKRTLMVDESVPVEDIFLQFCRKLGLSNNLDEYGLLVKPSLPPSTSTIPSPSAHSTLSSALPSPTSTATSSKPASSSFSSSKNLVQAISKLSKENSKRAVGHPFWLDLKESLRVQGVEEWFGVSFMKRFFVADDQICVSDSAQVNLVQSQCHAAFIAGDHFTLTWEDAIQFAALQCQILHGTFDQGFLDSQNLTKLLPQDFVKEKEMTPLIAKEWALMSRTTENNAKYHYITLFRRVKTFGILYYDAKWRAPGRQYLLPIRFGINKNMILFLDPYTKKVKEEHPFTHLRRWVGSATQLTIDFGSYRNEYITLWTDEAKEISDMLSGYVDRLTKPTKKKSNNQENQLLTRSMIELHKPAKGKESQTSLDTNTQSSASSHLSFRDPLRISALRSELALRKRNSGGGSLIASQRQTLLDEVRRKGGDISDVILTAPSRLNTDKWGASFSPRSNPSFLDNRSYRQRKVEKEKESENQRDEGDDRPDPFSVAAWEEVPRELINLTDAPVLGRGSNGAVYKVAWRGDDVALKMMLPIPKNGFVQAQKEFCEELKLMASLKSPYLVQLLAANTREDPFFILTEYMELGDLKGWLTEHKEIPIECVTRICIDICKGLAYLHAKGVIHRDLKPGNILLYGSKDNPRAKIGDFGTARSLAQTTTLTSEKGTYAYMAPEVMEMAVDYDGKVDMFSLGIMLYELLFDYHPFLHLNAPRLVMAYTKESRPDLPTAREVPEYLTSLLKRCWHVSPAVRPTAEEALHILAGQK